MWIASTPNEQLAPIYGALPSLHDRLTISDGDKGTEQTIAQMQQLVAAAKRRDDIRSLVGSIINPQTPSSCDSFSRTRTCPQKDYYCQAKACYDWIVKNIAYAYDPNLVEYTEAPWRVLKNGIGDCDSQDMLLCAMFEQLGLPAQFVTIKADPKRPDEFSHVYTRVQIPNYGWVVADPTMPNKYFGWEPEGNYKKRYWWSSTEELSMPLDTSPSQPAMQGFGMGLFENWTTWDQVKFGAIATAVVGLWLGYKIVKYVAPVGRDILIKRYGG